MVWTCIRCSADYCGYAPSRVKLNPVFNPPATEKLAFAKGSREEPSTKGAGEAAPISATNSTACRPFKGNSRIRVFSITEPTPTVSCFHQRGIGFDLDLFGHLADFESHVDCRAAINLQHDSGLDKGTESRQ